MKNMERFTPLYAITYAITKRFPRFSFLYELFYKRNKNIFSRVPIRCRTLVEVWENSKLRGNTCHFNFSFSQTSTRVFITVETRKMFFVEFKKTTENLSVIFV